MSYLSAAAGFLLYLMKAIPTPVIAVVIGALANHLIQSWWDNWRLIKRATETLGYWKLRLEVEPLLERPSGQQEDLKAIAQQAIEQCDNEVRKEVRKVVEVAEVELWKKLSEAEERKTRHAEEQKDEISGIRYWLLLYLPNPIPFPARLWIQRRPALSRMWRHIDTLMSWTMRCAFYTYAFVAFLCFADELRICAYLWISGAFPVGFKLFLLRTTLQIVQLVGYAIIFRSFVQTIEGPPRPAQMNRVRPFQKA